MWVRLAIIATVLVVAGVLAFVLLGDVDQLRTAIADAGPWGPVLFILIQIGQVFAAPIPGQLTGALAGFAFGATMGAVYATIGGTLGCALVFYLSRRLGRPFVSRFVSAELLERFDHIASNAGAWVLLVVFLAPIFPDDLICYIAGLSAIPLRTLILVALVGRLPGYVIFSLAGSGVADQNLDLLLWIGVAIVIVLGIAIWQRRRLERLVIGRGAPHNEAE